jgi:hypothetical protein
MIFQLNELDIVSPHLALLKARFDEELNDTFVGADLQNDDEGRDL